MNKGFILKWKAGASAGKISVTSGPHDGDMAAFRLSACSPDLQDFLRKNNASSLSVTFDLSETPTELRARDVNPA